MTMTNWWFEVDVRGERCFASVPPKCGLMSFLAGYVPGLPEVIKEKGMRVGEIGLAYAKARGLGPYTARDVVRQFPDAPRFLAVRHPLDRFRSIWKDKCDPKWQRHPSTSPGTVDLTAGMTPDELMDLVEAWPGGDNHWVPQWWFLVPRAKPLPFDRFNQLLGLPAVHTHRSRMSGEGVAFPEARILAHYARDLELWEGAQYWVDRGTVVP